MYSFLFYDWIQVWLQQDIKMFDQDNYESDEQGNQFPGRKKTQHKKATAKEPAPSTGLDFNQLTGQGQNLLKLMKQRGLDVSDKEQHKLKIVHQKSKDQGKTNKPKSGFFDGGNSATIEQLQKALKKSIAMADPNQASCILSYLLQRKNLPKQERNKYGSMKCNILYRMGAYEDCISKAQELSKTCDDAFSLAILHNVLAKCQRQKGTRILKGYMHLMRAKAEILNAKQQFSNKQTKQKQKIQEDIADAIQFVQDDFLDSQVDVILREIYETEMQYNLKMSSYKSKINMLSPHFQILKSRKVIQVSCGDYHTLFLVGSPLLTTIQSMDQETRLLGNQVFGIGQNKEGQIRGRPCNQVYKQPFMVSGLSGKNVKGVFAFKESSLAFDEKSNIYEWGVKQHRNQKIDLIACKINDQILRIQRGIKHYAILTKGNKLYTWGTIQVSGANLIKQNQPKIHDSINNAKIIDFSCGHNHVIAVDQDGSGYALGNNQEGQLCLGAQRNTKIFKKIQGQELKTMGKLKKVQCIEDCSFFITEDQQVYFCGKHSATKQSQQKLRQAQFSSENEETALQIGGSIGNYHVITNVGTIYRWRVDESVKFKPDIADKNKICRAVYNMRGQQFYLMNEIQPTRCIAWRDTVNPQSYSPINYKILMQDFLGHYSTQVIVPIRCQIFLSTFQIDEKQLIKSNNQFLEDAIQMEEYGIIVNDSMIKVNEIIEMRLMSYKITRNQQKKQYCDLSILSDSSGKFYFYILLNNQKIFEEELKIQVSDKQREMQDKIKQERNLRDQQRKEKAQLQRQKMMNDKLRKQQQEQQRRKQTQRRAEQALKKHMRQKQQLRQKLQMQRKRRAQLQTGGGFDLNKLKKMQQDK